MKKYVKISALVLSAILFISCFTGCNALDELREQQAFWTDERNIMWNDVEYKLIPQCDYFYPLTAYNSSLCITEKDVPVLLSSLEGAYGFLSDDSIFIEIQDEYDYSSTFYCRTDKYDSIREEIESGFSPEGFCYSYYPFDPEKEIINEYLYTLTEEEANLIKDIYNSVTPIEITEDTFNADIEYDYCVELYFCAKEIYFRAYSGIDILINGDKYCIAEYSDDYTTTYVYEVADEYKPYLKSICDMYVEAEKSSAYYYDDYYYEEEIYEM